MNIKTTLFKSHKFIEITNSSGMKVTFSTFGAAIYSLYVDDINQILTPKNKNIFLKSDKYYGKTLGPIGGRVKDALIKDDDLVFRLGQNEGRNALHGGVYGYSFKRFKVRVEKSEESAKLIFSLHTPFYKGPYFTNIDVKVTYIIYENSNEIDTIFEATSKHIAHFNLANHCYFSLGEKCVEDLLVTLKAGHYYKMDEELIPIELVSVDKTFDFSLPKLLKTHINDESLYAKKLKGYDHIFVFDNVAFDTPKAILEGSKFRLKVYSTYDACIMYSDNYNSNNELDDGRLDAFRSGVTIETMASKPIKIDNKTKYYHKNKYIFERK